MSKQETKCTPSQQPNQGLSAEQAMQAHAGWEAARAGLPFEQSNGPLWSEGWLNYHLLKSDPRRSWLRH